MAKKNKYQKAADEYAGSMWDAIRVGRSAGEDSAQDNLEGKPQTPTLTYDEPTIENKPVSDYEYNQNLVNSILKEPMKPEEEEKRAKAAHTIGGIGAFGNAISALSNLAFTGQGAPSQTLPELPDVYGKVKEMQDRNQKDRENYLRYKSAARQQDRSEWAQDQQMRGQQIDRKNSALKSNYDMRSNEFWKGLDYKTSRGDKQASENAEAYKFGVGQSNADRSYDLQSASLAEQIRANKAREAFQQQQFAEQVRQFGLNYDLQTGTVPVMSVTGDASKGIKEEYLDINPRKISSLNIDDIAKSMGGTPEGDKAVSQLNAIRAKRQELLGIAQQAEKEVEEKQSKAEKAKGTAVEAYWQAKVTEASGKATALKAQLSALDAQELSCVSAAVRDNSNLRNWLVNSGAATVRSGGNGSGNYGAFGGNGNSGGATSWD